MTKQQASRQEAQPDREGVECASRGSFSTNCPCCSAGTPVSSAQYGAVELIGQLAPLAAKGIEALAQGGARGHRTQTQGLVRKALGAKAFDGLEVVLAQGEQAQVALEDVAVGNPAAHRVLGVNQGRQVDALEQPPDQGQSALAAELVGQLLDFKVDGIGHEDCAHPLGAGLIWCRMMYCNGNVSGFEGGVTDSGCRRMRSTS